MKSPQYTNLILDLGDVLLRWSAHTHTSIPARMLRELLSSFIWHLYESSKIDQAECYRRLGEEFTLEPSTIAEAFSQARDSLTPNEELVSFIRELRRLHPGLRVFAMSNISVCVAYKSSSLILLALITIAVYRVQTMSISADSNARKRIGQYLTTYLPQPLPVLGSPILTSSSWF